MKAILWFLSVFLGGAAALYAQVNTMSVAPAENDNSVEAEYRSFTPAKGYRVALFASEALGIANPCAMRWDERGRLWVLTIPSYPHPEPGIKPNDRLIILEDTDGDGKADRSSVFADSLHMPLGFELGHGGVYLGQQTELLKLTDTDGDGKADKKEVLLSGFGTHDSHQTINSFTWSPGGELFFSQGHSIYSRVETAWGVKMADRAAIWRYRPRTRQTDVFLDGSTASVNPWGMNFGDWGEMFHKANDPELFYTAPGLVNTTHRQLLPPIGKLVIKGSVIEIARTKHLPPDLQGDFIVAGYYNNKVERMRVREEASGYAAQLLEPLLTASSRSFRPVDISVGPDGAIYVLDWYNPIIGHYQASMRHPDRDNIHGRIWRITAEDRPLAGKPDLENATIAQLLDYLKSEEHWVKYQARRLLAGKDTRSVTDALRKWTARLSENDPSYEKLLVEAMNVYQGHEVVETELLARLLAAKQEGARACAARIAGRWSDRLEAPLDYLGRLINDSHPRVRLEALVALSYIRDPEAMVMAAQVLDYPMDKFLQHALEKTTYALEPQWSAALKENRLKFKSQAHLAWLAGYRPPPWWTADTYKPLLEIPGLSAPVRRNLLINIARTGSSADMEFVTGQEFIRSDPGLLEALAAIPAKPFTAGLIRNTGGLLDASVPSGVRLAAVRLVKAWELKSLSPQLKAILNSRAADEKIKRESLLALVALQGQEALPSVMELRRDQRISGIMRIASLEALLRLDIAEAAKATVAEIKRSDTREDRIRDIVLPLFMQKGGTEAFAGALKPMALSREKVLKIQEAMGGAGIYAPGLSELLRRKAGGTVHFARIYSPGYVEGLAEAVLKKGDPLNGRKVYEAGSTCAACHAIAGKGGHIGPDLSAVGKGLSVREIITEVLWPGQNIKEGYNQVVAEMKTGEIIQGIKVFETTETVSVREVTTGKTIGVNKSSLRSFTETGSLMPEGLLDNYSENDVRDLVRFLSGLGK